MQLSNSSCKCCRMHSYSSSWWISLLGELINFLWPIWILNQIPNHKTLVEEIIQITSHKIYKMQWAVVETSWWWMIKSTTRMVRIQPIISPTNFCNRISSREVLVIYSTISSTNSYTSNSSSFYWISLYANILKVISIYWIYYSNSNYFRAVVMTKRTRSRPTKQATIRTIISKSTSRSILFKIHR